MFYKSQMYGKGLDVLQYNILFELDEFTYY